VWPLATGIRRKSGPVRNISRLLVFKLGGKASLPPAPALNELPLDPPALTGTPRKWRTARSTSAAIATSATAMRRSAGRGARLRRSGFLADPKSWQMIVHDGALKDNGMIAWSPVLTPAQIERSGNT
jgi:alcohol dehydrogenase (cytochrome c)/quinohemoprotein ethanol dehydrogenase